MSMAETASNISAQAEADPISDFRINEKSVVPIWIQNSQAVGVLDIVRQVRAR